MQIPDAYWAAMGELRVWIMDGHEQETNGGHGGEGDV